MQLYEESITAAEDPIIMELEQTMINKLFNIRSTILKIMEESLNMESLDQRALQPILGQILSLLNQYLFIARFDDIHAQPPTTRLGRLLERADDVYRQAGNNNIYNNLQEFVETHETIEVESETDIEVLDSEEEY